jgi:hypothetical protein
VTVVVLLASSYAVALLVAAGLLDRLAQHTARRSERFRTAGFRYSAIHDAWICPREQYLWPQEYDHHRRLVRYRATPSVCNACPVRAGCTSSREGREVVRALDPWPHSEAGRFHRGLALVLVAIAAIFAGTAAALSRRPPDVAVALVAVGLVGLVGWRLTGHLRSTPANFPAPTVSTGLRVETAVPRTRVPLVDGVPASRTRWASDRRAGEGEEGRR